MKVKKLTRHLEKNIWKLLIISIGFNNISSSASTLSDDTRYEYYEGNSIEVSDIKEDDEIDVEIEGNTLVNVLDKGFKEVGKYTQLHGTNLADDESFVTFNMADGYDRRAFRKFEHTSIRPATQYTLYVEIKENTIVSPDENLHVLYPISNTSDSAFKDLWGITAADAVGVHKRLVTTKDNFDGVTVGLRSYLRYLDGGTGTITYRTWLIEGNHMDKDIPYFEGLASVGEDGNIEIKSSNKNLFDSYLEHGTYSYATGKKMDHDEEMRTAEASRIKPNTSYSVSTNISTPNIGIYQYDKDFNFISSDYPDGKAVTFTSASNAYYLNLRFYNRDLTAQVQIEESSKKTDYIVPQNDNIEIKLNEPLRSLPNGIKDKIVKINGQWMIERNCGETILNGKNYEWGIFTDVSNGTTTHFQTLDYIAFSDTSSTALNASVNVLSDKFYNVSGNDQWFGITEETITSNMHGKIGIRINNSRLSSISVQGLNEWLSSNPIKVVYRLKAPIYESLKVNSKLNIYQDATNITNDSDIPLNLKITVDRVANRAIEAYELALANPTSVNISQARMWSNLMKDTSLKDIIQSDIDDISDIEDIVVEKKKVSANLDVYIKSENSLVMGISTNSVIFDNFSGVDDIEKKKAVDITVNSSLPYDLNAYLESDAYNSDKSKTLDRKIINLKLNDSADYQNFISDDKITLKQSSPEGINNIHSVDMMLKGNVMHEKDVYRAVIKFEAEQK